MSNEQTAENKAHSTLKTQVGALETKSESNQKLDISNHDSDVLSEKKLSEEVTSDQSKETSSLKSQDITLKKELAANQKTETADHNNLLKTLKYDETADATARSALEKTETTDKTKDEKKNGDVET